MKLFLLLLLGLFVLITRAEAANASAYDRVVKSRTLRCGYATWEPGVVKDPNTGKMRGLYVEMIEEMARMAKIRIDWTAEVDWGQIPQALADGKIDAFCAGMANDAARGLFLGYSRPITYWSFDVIVRADDARFSMNGSIALADLNKPEFKTAYTEGDVLETIKQTELPAVQSMALPPLATPADNLLNVVTGKTDFVIFPRVMIESYQQANPGKANALRLLKMSTPLRVYGNVIAVDIHERELLGFIDTGLGELMNSPSYGRILAPYQNKYPGAFLPSEKQYKLPE